MNDFEINIFESRRGITRSLPYWLRWLWRQVVNPANKDSELQIGRRPVASCISSVGLGVIIREEVIGKRQEDECREKKRKQSRPPWPEENRIINVVSQSGSRENKYWEGSVVPALQIKSPTPASAYSFDRKFWAASGRSWVAKSNSSRPSPWSHAVARTQVVIEHY